MTYHFKCGSSKVCKIWTCETFKDACTFDEESFVYSCRNRNCPLPVEIVLSTLVEGEYDR